MFYKRFWIRILLGAILIALLLCAGWQLSRWHQKSLAAAFRKTMSDPAFRSLQTVKLQPEVAQDIKNRFPDVLITPHKAETNDAHTYEVRLPPAEERTLPALFAEMCRVAGKYRKQGYQGTLLLYDKDRIIKSVTMK